MGCQKPEQEVAVHACLGMNSSILSVHGGSAAQPWAHSECS